MVNIRRVKGHNTLNDNFVFFVEIQMKLRRIVLTIRRFAFVVTYFKSA